MSGQTDSDASPSPQHPHKRIKQGKSLEKLILSISLLNVAQYRFTMNEQHFFRQRVPCVGISTGERV